MLVLKTELAMPNSIHGLMEIASLGRFWDLNRASRTTEMGSGSAADKPAIFVLFMAASARGEM
ncbi:hypothetical protein [Devosia sp. MC1541]|uniref:hypothetical protein n=1 Tax=Devosia sp. MC1541 TaxID=2725264 RepID=UPI00145C7996|nr:hypothetical protein [Devosia sp. MC1541]